MPTLKEIINREVINLLNTKELRTFTYKIPQVNNKTLFLTGCVHNHSGYDCLVRQIIKGFLSQNINFRVNSTCHCEEFSGLMHPRVRGSWELVVKTPPSLHKFNITKKSILLAMWETDGLDRKWVAEMNKAHAIITPSTWGKEMFECHGVNVPIHVVHLGYDPLSFHQEPHDRDQPFTFGVAASLGEGGIRKNVHYTIECFHKAFQGEENIRLKLKLGAKDNIAVNDPRIEITSGILSEPELADWYRSLDCYVHLSAAEGWGLHVIEAMACGIPVISTTYSSMKDYISEDVGLIVDYKEIDVGNLIYQGKQCKPVQKSVIEALQWANNNQNVMKDRGEWAAMWVKQFQWKDFGQNLLRVISAHNVL